MRILVCIKQVPDPSSLITIDPSGRWIDESKASFRMNRYDEHAIEEALKIKDSCPGTAVDAITVGPQRASSVIRRALEMGADEGFHIIAPAGFIKPYFTASMISEHIKRIPYDIILCGHMSEDDMLSQTGPMIAAMMNMPFLTSVISLDINAFSGQAITERDLSSGKRQKLQSCLPCVFALQASINRPRYPSLSNVLRAKKQKINTIESAEHGSLQTGFNIAYPEKSASGAFLNGSIDEKAEQLAKILHEHSLI